MNFKWWLRRVRAYVGRPRALVQVKPVILGEENRCENPIFLIGVHRSGTSLTRRILNSHRNIACPPESFYFVHYANMLRDETTFAGYRGMGYETPAECIAHIASQASALHEAFRIANGKGRWADKTPQYTAILPDLLSLFGPKAQFLLLYRHPFDILHSIDARGWEMGEPGLSRFEGNAAYVRERTQAMRAFATHNPGLCHSLRYEDLVAEPEATLRAVCEFLGEAWDPAMLEFHKFDHNVGTEDPIVRSSSGFSESRDNWKSFSEEKLGIARRELLQTATELGYDCG